VFVTGLKIRLDRATNVQGRCWGGGGGGGEAPGKYLVKIVLSLFKRNYEIRKDINANVSKTKLEQYTGRINIYVA
jgi:hypothetical protein